MTFSLSLHKSFKYSAIAWAELCMYVPDCAMMGRNFKLCRVMSSPTNNHVRKIMEVSMIALKRPTLNAQVESHRFLLFQNGVT